MSSTKKILKQKELYSRRVKIQIDWEKTGIVLDQNLVDCARRSVPLALYIRVCP